MRKGFLAMFVFVAAFAQGVVAADGLSGKVSVSGAWALYPMVVKWAEEFKKVHPGVSIDVAAGGAGKGMTDAISGAVDFGMVSREVVPAELEKGAFAIPVTKDAVVPMMSVGNPFAKELREKGLKREVFVGIWVSGKVKTWEQALGKEGGKTSVQPYTRSDSCGAAETWAKYLGKKQEDLQGTGVYGDPGLAQAVAKDDLGIGYNNIGFAYNYKTGKPVEGVMAIPVDVNGDGKISADEDFYGDMKDLVKAIVDGRYPSPPARDLNMVSKGIPKNPAAKEFLMWILTDGQKFVPEAGFVNLDAKKLDEQVKKLDAK